MLRAIHEQLRKQICGHMLGECLMMTKSVQPSANIASENVVHALTLCLMIFLFEDFLIFFDKWICWKDSPLWSHM
jgi:hypothetical protein